MKYLIHMLAHFFRVYRNCKNHIKASLKNIARRELFFKLFTHKNNGDNDKILASNLIARIHKDYK
ncbi:hypothetical protein A9Q75_07920 [Colwellia psychrerythraea]|uniref:Uncharacterized protein n=1 Tax=Colwellia psychrerythraea TaxID=28229 RepID=A0A1Y5EFP8_COLPS|nr:hypothetical protein A9Q75_07920 [Colwellia psychrerythraea]